MTRLLTALTLVFLAIPAFAADPDAIAATVGNDQIRAGEVQRLAAKATRGKKLGADSMRVIQAQTLEEIIARRLVLAYASRRSEAPSDTELAAALADLKTQLAAHRRTLDSYLKIESVRRSDLNRQLAWNIVWQKYSTRYVTDDRLASFFAAHHRDYDGTQLVVSHILLRPSGDVAKNTEDLLQRAAKIREEIVEGKLSFADAVDKYSTGPSRKDGGRLGPIERHGPMGEAFSRPAFALEVGEISPPVKTAFGVHLIRCDEITPGDKKLADVRKELEDALRRELLEKLANAQRQYSPVEYTDVLPHFKPGTHDLAPAVNKPHGKASN